MAHVLHWPVMGLVAQFGPLWPVSVGEWSWRKMMAGQTQEDARPPTLSSSYELGQPL